MNTLLKLQSRIHQPFYFIGGIFCCIITIPLSFMVLGMFTEFPIHDLFGLGTGIFIPIMIIALFLWGCHGIKIGLTKE